MVHLGTLGQQALGQSQPELEPRGRPKQGCLADAPGIVKRGETGDPSIEAPQCKTACCAADPAKQTSLLVGAAPV